MEEEFTYFLMALIMKGCSRMTKPKHTAATIQKTWCTKESLRITNLKEQVLRKGPTTIILALSQRELNSKECFSGLRVKSHIFTKALLIKKVALMVMAI